MANSLECSHSHDQYQGMAQSINFIITEKNHMDQDYVVFHQSIVQLQEIDYANWALYSLQQQKQCEDGDNDTHKNGISVQLTMKQMTRPLYSQQD